MTHERKRPPRREWRTIVLSILRAGAASALIIFGSVVTMFAPDSRSSLAAAIIGLLIFWTAIFVFYVKWQLRGIGSSSIPLLRGLEALFVGLVLFISIFAKAYLLISKDQPLAFTEPLDGFTAYYYAITVLSTVGFGDITPVGVLARAVTMTQMILDLAFVAVTARIIFSEVQRTRMRRTSSAPAPDAGQ